MSNEVHERADSPKVRTQIKKDAYQATKTAIEKVREHLTGRGFDRNEIAPLIREGAHDAASEL